MQKINVVSAAQLGYNIWVNGDRGAVFFLVVLSEHSLSAEMCDEELATQPLKCQKGNFLQPEEKFSLSC